MLTKAEQAAKRDIAKEVHAYFPDSSTWDQFNATVSYVFTSEARRLNRKFYANPLNV